MKDFWLHSTLFCSVSSFYFIFVVWDLYRHVEILFSDSKFNKLGLEKLTCKYNKKLNDMQILLNKDSRSFQRVKTCLRPKILPTYPSLRYLFTRRKLSRKKRNESLTKHQNDQANETSLQVRLFTDHRSHGIQRLTIFLICCRSQAHRATITMAIATSSKDVER